MEKYKSIYKAREEILDIVKKDIIGPVDTEEILVEIQRNIIYRGNYIL